MRQRKPVAIPGPATLATSRLFPSGQLMIRILLGWLSSPSCLVGTASYRCARHPHGSHRSRSAARNFACSGPDLRAGPAAAILRAPKLAIENLFSDRFWDSPSSSHKQAKPNKTPFYCGLVHRAVYSIPRRSGSLCSLAFGAAKPSKPFSIRFLYIGSYVCSTLLSDSARDDALALRYHFTSIRL